MGSLHSATTSQNWYKVGQIITGRKKIVMALDPCEIAQSRKAHGTIQFKTVIV